MAPIHEVRLGHRRRLAGRLRETVRCSSRIRRADNRIDRRSEAKAVSNEHYLIVSYFLVGMVSMCLGIAVHRVLRTPFCRNCGSSDREIAQPSPDAGARCLHDLSGGSGIPERELQRERLCEL